MSGKVLLSLDEPFEFEADQESREAFRYFKQEAPAKRGANISRANASLEGRIESLRRA